MENKLQELTQKLYAEGLSKGKQEAEVMVADAEKKASEILESAKVEAEKIVAEAKKQAEEFTKNTATEVSLASAQSVATLKDAISSMVISEVISDNTAKACLDVEFIKEFLLAVAGTWNGVGGAKADLVATLPEALKAKVDTTFAASVKALLSAGVEVEYSSGVKSGFKIAPKDGGYYISFTDEDFKALLKDFLRSKVEQILFEK